MSICLNMIVKNESKNLDRLLSSLKGVVDECIIVDTGSLDDTVSKCGEFAKNLPFGGQVLRLDWPNDFSKARQAALDVALANAKSHHILIMDADEELVGISKYSLKTELDPKISYRIAKYAGNFKNEHINLLSKAYCWTWFGKIHEWIIPVEDHEIRRTNWAKIVCNLDQGGRTGDRTAIQKYEEDCLILEDLIKQRIDVPRNTFYLAMTYKALSDYSTAWRYFESRVRMKGHCPQQSYRALIEAAKCCGFVGDTATTKEILMEALEFRPRRAEAYYHLSQIFKNEKIFNTAKVFAKAGLERLHSGDTYMLEADVHEWKMLHQYCTLCLLTNSAQELTTLCTLEDLLEESPPTLKNLEYIFSKRNLLEMIFEYEKSKENSASTQS